MLNKFFKTIHNKYSRFFEFIFFLRYLLLIFFISLVIFLSIPAFFNFEKRAEIIKNYLIDNYNYKISNYEKIRYNIFPLPSIELSNAQVNLKSNIENLNVKKIKIYLNFLKIYDYKNFDSNKVIFKDSNITFQIRDFKLFAEQLIQKKKKISFDNLNLRLVDKKIPITTLSNIKFANYGYNQNLIKGKIFNKNFEVKIDDNLNNINFKLLKSGINTDLNFYNNKKKNIKLGTLKSKILNTNLKANFEYNGEIIKIYNSNFRSKSLSFKNESKITIKPYLDIESKFVVEEFNTHILKRIDFAKLFEHKNLLRKINSKNQINFKSKKFSRNLFEDLNFKINLAYGRMNFTKKMMINNSVIQCDGSLNFLEEYPLLFFDCNVAAENKREFFKKFSIKIKNKNEKLMLNFKGNLSILNKKVNFKNISMNEDYIASNQDLKYFKEIFEKNFFDKGFFEIFDSKKIKKFIIEIS